MHNVVTKLISIQKEIQEKNNKTKVIAVSKTFKIEDIIPLINHGHRDFGENKIQEAVQKWTSVKENYSDINLHMIGKIQSNKVKLILPLFEYVHSLDSAKLAEKISEEQKKYKKNIKIFIQVNIGNEEQKSGIPFAEVDGFFNYCTREKKMQILGLMAIPPNNENVEKYFKNLSELNSSLGLTELSLGMSSDYITAIKYKSTYLRLGSSIFGERT